jgi:hypothetical protein
LFGKEKINKLSDDDSDEYSSDEDSLSEDEKYDEHSEA